MHTFLQDLRYGIRVLLKTPGVTAVALLALALGIGANTAIFTGVNAFLFRTLPAPEPDQLVRLYESTEDRGATGSFSYPDFSEYRDQGSSFAEFVAEEMAQAALSTENQNDVIWGQFVSGNYFDVLRINPTLGRPFAADEDRTPGTHAVVVISHRLWQRRFAADQNIVGKTIELNSRPFHVIGVAPEFFNGTNFGLALDFWVPMMMVEDLKRDPGLLAARNAQWLTILGRLKPGVTKEQAEAGMAAISQRLNQTYPNIRAKSTRAIVLTEIDGRWDEATPVMKSASAIALVVSGLILLIACANVANLMLARAAARRKEIGVRLALGASRLRLLRQLLTESLLLSLLGGGLGLLLAYWVVDLMRGFVPVLPYEIVSDFFSIDERALGFTAVISLLTGIVFGLAPAWHASNPDIVPVLKNDVPGTLGGRRRLNLRNSLVVSQVALSLVVLLCGVLFIKSFRNAQKMDPGFVAEGVLLVSMNPELVGYEGEQSKDFFRRVLEQTTKLPGVEAASFSRLMPLGDSSNSSGPILKTGETLPAGTSGRNIMNNVVTPGHFKTLQIPMIAGRDFDARDHKDAPRVIIVNERMADMLWPGESAVGKQIFIGTGPRSGPIEVVGVVKTGKYRSLAEDPRPYYYYPMAQRGSGYMTLAVRTTGDPRALINPIRSEILAIDRRIPLYAIRTINEHMTWPLWAPSLAATLSLAFGLVALLLSAVGLYSVMAYVVSQRTRELGIRMALGADRRHVLKLITGQGLRLAVIGVALGLVLSAGLARVVSSVLIGVSAYDLTAFVVVPILLGVVALIACLIPARRATKVDPLVALRYE